MSVVHVLTNVTLNTPQFIGAMGKELDAEIRFPAGFNVWRQHLLDPSRISSQKDSLFLILDGRKYLEEALASSLELQIFIANDLNLISGFIKVCPEVFLIACDLDIPPTIVQSLDHMPVESVVMNRWCEGIYQLGRPVLNLANIAADMGRANFYSAASWYAGALPWSLAGQKRIADEIGFLWRAFKIPRKKVLILDLDNTLWGGVIGEDGVEGLKLAPTGSGASYRDFQLCCKSLKNQGVLLAVVSKNNKEDVLAALKSHPHMVLREEDFVSIHANWEAKSANILAIANELNLGTDSFVFVDDNPVERESVRLALPEVIVPSFPDHPSRLPDFCRSIARNWFMTLHVSKEDMGKTDAYRQEKLRKETAREFSSLDDYLRYLQMELTISPIKEKDIPRASQLTMKTNQFNLTAKRLTENEIMGLIAEPPWMLYQASLKDRFGDYGVIALCFARMMGNVAHLEIFLMSCRAMGRNVEQSFLGAIENQLFMKGVTTIKAYYRATTKNNVVKCFYQQNGYDIDDEGVYTKKLTSVSSISTFLSVIIK